MIVVRSFPWRNGNITHVCKSSVQTDSIAVLLETAAQRLRRDGIYTFWMMMIGYYQARLRHFGWWQKTTRPLGIVEHFGLPITRDIKSLTCSRMNPTTALYS